MLAEEGVHERVWQGDDLDNGYQTGTRDSPERCLWEVFTPEDLPASDGPSVGAEVWKALGPTVVSALAAWR
jgi:hypothetical protein